MSNEPPVSILLVDDKAENLLALESVLEHPGYHLVRAHNGDEALLALLKDEYAAIVLDVKMPGMSGIELAQIIRSRKKTQNIPILFLTAHGQDNAVAGYEAGGVDFLTKPIQPSILRSKMAVFADLFRTSISLKAEIEERRQAEARVRQLNEELFRRVEELAAVNAELEAFSYMVSHDLRAPLRQVTEFVGLLQEGLAGKVAAEDAEYIPLIKNSVARMGELIDDLLNFSRMGRVELNLTSVRLAPLVDQVRVTLSPVLQGRDIRWTIGPLPAVSGDQALLRQVLTNLLDNAVKFTRTRERAEIEVGALDEGEEQIFFVRDNGVGFDPTYAGNLFGVFQRLHSTAEFEGTGIGLASVRRIIQRHGGRTWAESAPGQGTVVYCSLPVRAAKQ